MPGVRAQELPMGLLVSEEKPLDAREHVALGPGHRLGPSGRLLLPPPHPRLNL